MTRTMPCGHPTTSVGGGSRGPGGTRYCIDCERVARAAAAPVRCPGCGRTPCEPDARGCCPNRPDTEPPYMDDSWGDYETEPES